jgi:hypothetical protein
VKKFIFITVRNYTSDVWLNEKLVQLTHACQRWWAHDEHECIIVDSYQDIENYRTQTEWLIVQTAGDIIIEQYHLWNCLNNIPDDVGYIGHLVWYNKDTPSIEPQCFILRTDAVDKLDFTNVVKTGRVFARSKDDVHQGSSPLYITLTNNSKLQHYDFGAEILNQILSKGYKATHFNNAWRFTTPSWKIKNSTITNFLTKYSWPGLPSRGYTFPKQNTTEFAYSLKNLELIDNLDDAQELFIAIIKGIIDLQHNNTLNVLNWDSIEFIDSAEHIITPANGLLAECLAHTSNANKITFYDINPRNLEFKQHLYDNWDGHDYINFAIDWANKHNLIMEPKCENGQQLSKRYQDMIDQVSNNWSKFKSMEVDFILVDLAKSPSTIINSISHKTILHTSTILNYYILTHVLHDQGAIDSVRKNIAIKIKNTNSYWLET